MLPIGTFVKGLITSVVTKKILGREVGEFTNKTTGVASAASAFAIYQLTSNPDDKVYIFILIFSMFMVTIRHTLDKIIKLLDK